MDLSELQRQFSGRRFGELVLHHHKSVDLATMTSAVKGTIAELPPAARGLVESWIDEVGPRGKSVDFWQADCGEVFKQITTRASARLRMAGVDPTSDDLFNMFQIIVLNFAYAAHKHAQSKAFIQKALGVGFFGRLFG